MTTYATHSTAPRLPVHRSGDNLGTNPPLPEDKLCTSCGQRISSRNFSETSCAACGNRRRTTPTPSTTGGPLGGNSGGGRKRETADTRRGPTRPPGHAENDRRAREQVLRNRFPQETAPRSRIPGEGRRETAGRSRRPSSAHGGRRCERRATGPRPRVRDHGAASGRPRARRRPDARTAARTPVRAAGATRRRTDGRAAGPSISYIEGPAPVSGCPIPPRGPGTDTTRGCSHAATLLG